MLKLTKTTVVTLETLAIGVFHYFQIPFPIFYLSPLFVEPHLEVSRFKLFVVRTSFEIYANQIIS